MLRTRIAKVAAVSSLVVAALAAPVITLQSTAGTVPASVVVADAGWQVAPTDAGWQ